MVDTVTDVIQDTSGIDTIQSSVTFSLADPALAGIEYLTLTGTAPINGAGNDIANVLTGNAASNVLSGGLGNDILNGGAGIDTLNGCDGNDTYVVDTITDVIQDTSGIDTIQSSVTISLATPALAAIEYTRLQRVLESLERW